MILVSRIQEFQAELEAYKKGKGVEAAEFDPKAVIAVAKSIQKLVDKDWGIVRYGILTLRDSEAIQPLLKEAKSEEERSQIILWAMLRKAYPDLALEDVKDLPLTESSRVLQRMLGVSPINFPQPASSDGSKSARKPKK